MKSERNVQEILQNLSEQDAQVLYEKLKVKFGTHPLEEVIGMKADELMEIISTVIKQNDMTWRMLRGVIAEMTWGVTEVKRHPQWRNNTPRGDLPFDFLVSDGHGDVTVQVKLQRSEGGKPMLFKKTPKFSSTKFFCVETQKTRGGKKRGDKAKATEEETRFYKYGEFDILAVSLMPSSEKWDDFIYTVADWLLPDPQDGKRIGKYQPVAIQPDDYYWTQDFNLAVSWLRQNIKRRLSYTPLLF